MKYSVRNLFLNSSYDERFLENSVVDPLYFSDENQQIVLVGNPLEESNSLHKKLPNRFDALKVVKPTEVHFLAYFANCQCE